MKGFLNVCVIHYSIVLFVTIRDILSHDTTAHSCPQQHAELCAILCRHSWREACAQLAIAVEDSRKQKRRGTPNAIVLAGMSMPAPFETPVQMPKRHVRLLHQLRREVREGAGLPPLKADVKDEGVLVAAAALSWLHKSGKLRRPSCG
jgi:hypothetical protein